MDINQVRFGNYSVGSHGARSRQQDTEAKEEQATNAGNSNANAYSPEGVLSAYELMGLQNKAQITTRKPEEIDVDKYLTPERQAEIEAMMGNFSNGVNFVGNVIDKEFPGLFSDEQRNALAAQIFAQG